MIKEIDIVNFQSHESSSLELASGVNVIVGASDSGKSAIIRALRWLIWNRPVGDAFMRHGTEGCFVNIVTDQMDVIQRAKGPGGNQYRINEQEFKAIGNEVPQPIQEILNLDETNLQRQGESPFLISNSPGEVSSYFNKVAKLDKIDSSLKYITSQAKSLTGQIKSDESRLQNLELEAGQYEYLTTAEIQLEVLEEDYRNQHQRRSGLQTLRELEYGIIHLENTAKLEQEIVDRESAVDDLLDMHTMRTQALEGLDMLQQGFTEWTTLNADITTQTVHQKLLDPVNQILYNYGARDTVITNIETLKEHVKEMSMLAINTKTAQIQLANKGELFYMHMPDTCPLCGK